VEAEGIHVLPCSQGQTTGLSFRFLAISDELLELGA
jgi:hypothetical protein